METGGVCQVLSGITFRGCLSRLMVLPMTYVNRDMLLAMSKQHVWDAATPEGYHPRCSLAVVKLFPANPVYALTTIYCAICTGEAALPSCLNANLHNSTNGGCRPWSTCQRTVCACLSPLVAITILCFP